MSIETQQVPQRVETIRVIHIDDVRGMPKIAARMLGTQRRDLLNIANGRNYFNHHEYQ